MPVCPPPIALVALVLAVIPTGLSAQPADAQWIVYEGSDGPGNGKHIVFVTGDEEYRSEEGMPMLARILADRHGFTCTVLFAVDPKTGFIAPDIQTNIPGLHLLESADLMVLFTRFRELPEDDMRRIVDYTKSGKPIIGLRTATHPFNYTRDPDDVYAVYDFRSTAAGYEGGYGRMVFGETWVNHHGDHGTESTRGVVNELLEDHPILNGVDDVWGPTDVYEIRDLPDDAEVLLFGQTLRGMEPKSPPNVEKSLMPIAWTRRYRTHDGDTARVFFTTMGASVDLENEGLRRLLVNAVYWSFGMEDVIPERAKVDYVGPYDPTFFGFGDHRKGVAPH